MMKQSFGGGNRKPSQCPGVTHTLALYKTTRTFISMVHLLIKARIGSIAPPLCDPMSERRFSPWGYASAPAQQPRAAPGSGVSSKELKHTAGSRLLTAFTLK